VALRVLWHVCVYVRARGWGCGSLTALSRDKDYATLGPIGLIAWSQKLHATFLADHEWPALATKLPSANYARTGQDQTKRACFECGDPDHMRPDCPKLKAERDKGAEQSTMATDDTAPPPPAEKRSTRRGGGGGGANSRDPTPLAAWKYIEPKDSTKEHPDSNQKPWKWCSKCKCKSTGRQGIMQLSHFDKDHVQGFRVTEKTAMMVSVADPDQGVPLAPPTITNTEPDDEEEDPDGLVFTGAGMWHSEVCYDLIPVNPPPPSIELAPVDAVPVAPMELLHPAMWCAPAIFFPHPPSLLSSVEREIATAKKDTCDIDAKNPSDSEPKAATAKVTRLEAVWLSLLLLFGTVFALGLQYVAQLKDTLIDVVWNSVKFQLFFWTTLFWDTVAVYTVTPNKEERTSMPRRIRRKVQRHCGRAPRAFSSIFFCTASWLVLSDSVHDIHQEAQPAHPFV
jgi:hypothetical protein